MATNQRLHNDIRASAGVDRELFANVMAALAGGVAVVTTLDRAGAPAGLTTTALCSASAEPPLLLVCLDRTSRTLPSIRAARRFVVNVIRAGEDRLCRLFASKSNDKFAGVRWRPTATGLPVLFEHALAWAQCRTTAEYDAGDHVIFLGAIEAAEVVSDDLTPLVYYRRGWGGWNDTAIGGDAP